MAPMTKKDLEAEIKRIHDAIIRLEPVCDMVTKHEKTLYNNGWGVAAQVKVLWAVFITLTGVVIKVAVK